MVLLFLVCAVLPVAVLGTASYIALADSLREQAYDRARLTAKRVGATLAERFGNLDGTLISLAAVFAEAPALFGQTKVIDDRFVALAVTGSEGRHSLFGVMAPVPVLDAAQQRHLQSGRTIITLSTDTSRALLMARQIVAADPRGVMWAQVSDSIMDRVFAAEAATGMPARYCLVLRDAAVVRCVTPSALRRGALAPALASAQSGAFVWGADERYLAGFWSLFLRAQYGSPDWRIIFSQPEAEILAPLARFRRTFALTALLAILVVALLSTGQIRRSLGPLDALRVGTERIARLDFDRPVEVSSGDEFEDLASAFNSMSDRVRAQFVEARRLNEAIASKSAALEEREARMTAILHASADAIVTVDVTGRVESFNRTAERIFGLPETEAIGRPLDDFFGVPLAGGPGSRQQAVHTGHPTLEVAGRRRDGATFPTEVKFTEARAKDRILQTVFIRDISEQKRGAEERERLEAQLRHAQKMDTIGTLAGGIAHDFNNILSPIIMNVELALEAPQSTEMNADLKQILSAALRAKGLVRQILLFSRRGETAFSTIPLAPIVKEALELLRSSIPSTVQITSSIDPDVASVVGDPTQLHQVVMNLCTNAAHAMRDHGGTLDVRVGMVDMQALVGGRATEQRAVRLVVRDTGQGMDAATLDRLFEPFFTTKPVGEGTGLGLSIVHGIITQHGGTIAVESAPGSGTTFEIHLPAAEQKLERGEPVGPALQVRGEGRVLVVDDDAVIAQLVARVLGRAGYDVAQATVASDVLRMLAEAEPPFDLVITDQTMPGMTGLELADRIHGWRSGFPIILLTGYSGFGGQQDPRQHGLRDVLMKPVPISVLAASVARILNEERSSIRNAGPPIVAAGTID